MDYRDWNNRDVRANLDIECSITNRKYTLAYNLLELILENIGYESFNLEDIREHFNSSGFNPMAEKYYSVGNFGKSHLETLVNEGILEHDERTKLYEINPNSQKLILYFDEGVTNQNGLLKEIEIQNEQVII